MAIQLPYTDGIITPVGVSNLESKDNKGTPNGYAPLDANAKVPVANLPDQASLDAEVDAKITTHNSATTSVHGIANTANLVLTNDARLSDTRDPKAHTHTKSNITDFTHTHAVADVTGLQTTLNGKALLSHAHAIADVTGLQTAIDNSGIKAGVQWTDRHTTSTGNQYAVGSIVYNAGRVFRCLATNDSITPAVGGNAYWADLGAGYLLPNENPKIQGGTIEISGGASIVLKSGTSGDADGGNGGAILQVGGNSANGSVQTGEDENGDPIYEDIDQVGGNAGYIWQNGATGGDYGAGGSAGYIDTSAYQGNSGGNVNTTGGISGGGGSIDTSNGGGSINTKGTGSIQLGVNGARTTLNGSASGGNKTITLPNTTGTIALTSDSRFTDPRTPTTHSHGVIGNTGELNGGTIIQLNIIVNNIPNGTWPVLQALHPNFPDLAKNSSAQVQVSGTSPNKTLTILNGGVGYNATQSVTIAGVVGSITGTNSYDKPLISNGLGYVSAGSFGTTLYSFCQGNDPRLSDNRTPTSHTHGNITNAGAIGSTANLPLITTTSGVVTTGSFGTTANSFCQGDDSRLSNNRTPTAHKSTHATGGTDALSPSDIGASATGHTHTASEISDSTTAGRALLTASTTQAQRTALDTFVTASNLAAIQALAGNFQRIYLALDTAKTYVWNGTGYTEVSPNQHARSGTGNTNVGETALSSASLSGAGNVAVGTDSLKINTSGAYNTSVGIGALQSNQTGGSNTAVGSYALQANQGGIYNTGVGQGALYQNTASENCAIGLNAGFSITSGGKNVCIGSEADVDTGARAGCVVLGYRAKSPAVDGSLAIGGTGGNAMNALTTTTAPTGATGTWLSIWLNGLEYRIPIQKASYP